MANEKTRENKTISENNGINKLTHSTGLAGQLLQMVMIEMCSPIEWSSNKYYSYLFFIIFFLVKKLIEKL